jgi:T5SS/PEP-CTERM-associated repeat protein
MKRTRRALELSLVALALATPAGAGIMEVRSRARLGASSQTGIVLDREVIDVFDVTDLHETFDVATQGGHARAVLDVTLNQTADSATLTASGSTDYSHCCAGERTPDNFGKGAKAGSALTFQVCGDGRLTFTASVNASLQSSDEDSMRTLLEVRTFVEDSLLDETLADEPGFARSASHTFSGAIDPDPVNGLACVEVSADLSGGLNEGQPSAGGSWSLTLTVGITPVTDGDAFVWTGTSSGSFADPSNWDPVGPGSEGVPSFVDGVRGDAALVTSAGPVTIDLAGSAAAAAPSATPLARGVPIQRRMGRLAVARTQPLKPIRGLLILDNLGQDLRGTALTVDGRSLEVGQDALASLDEGIVRARHVAIGSGGDGTLVVRGPDGGFVSLGRFGLGADGDGLAEFSDGAVVTTAESVLGEVDGQGSVLAQGEGTLWQTGNLAVGLADSGSLAIEGGARVESGEVAVDFALAGDETAEASVRGKTPGGTPSTWALGGDLGIGPRGKVSIEDGGALAGLGLALPFVRIGTSGSDADCLLGQACLEVTDGSVSSAGVVVGANGSGKLRIGLAGRVSAQTEVEVGDASGSRGEVAVTGPSAEPQLAANLLVGTKIGSHGELVLAGGARARTRIGKVGGEPGSSGLIELQATGSEATVLVVEGGADPHLDLGVDLPAPDASIFGATGELALAGGRLELNDADLNVRTTGEVTGTGRIDGSGVSFVSNHGRIGCGVVVNAAYTQGPDGVLECPQASLPPAPQMNPLAASRLLRSARKKPAPPAPPPPGPFVVTGDASLDGTLVLQFLNGFAPRQGDSFELVDVAGSVTGAFDSVVVRGLTAGVEAFAQDFPAGKLMLTALTDLEALPAVSLTGKTRLKEKKKAGLKLKIRRDGDTSAPLLVSYAIRGTAENGIDYELLPGTLEIPARKKSAKLVVKPRRDGRIEGPETIELELLPGVDYAPSLFSEHEIALTSADKPKQK